MFVVLLCHRIWLCFVDFTVHMILLCVMCFLDVMIVFCYSILVKLICKIRQKITKIAEHIEMRKVDMLVDAAYDCSCLPAHGPT